MRISALLFRGPPQAKIMGIWESLGFGAKEAPKETPKVGKSGKKICCSVSVGGVGGKGD